MILPGYGIHGLHKTRLKDRTTDFLNFLMLDTSEGRVGQEYSWMADIRGTTGSGKTTFAYILFDLMLRINPRRYIVYYRQDDSNIRQLNNVFPYYMKNKIFNVDHIVEISEIPNHIPHEFIFYIDEAGLDANAKEALSKEMRPIVKMGKSSRHRKQIILMGDQTNSFLKDYRALCHFHFYKRISDDYFNEYDDWFAKTYHRKLQHLEDHQVAFRDNYKYFRYEKEEKQKYITKGLLSFPMEEYIPWNLQEIEETSQYLRNENIDHDYAQKEKIDLKITEYGKIIYDTFGEDLIQPRMERTIQRWLETNYSIDYYILEKYIRKIYNEALLIRYNCLKAHGSLIAQETTSEKKILQAAIRTNYNNGLSFADYCKAEIEAKAEGLPDSQASVWIKRAIVAQSIIAGFRQEDITTRLKISLGTVCGLWGWVKENTIGYLFENWSGIAFHLHIIGGNENYPDGFDNEGRIYTIKFRSGRRKALQFHKNKDFHPENLLANYLKVPYYLILTYPEYWKTTPLKIIKIDPYPSIGGDNFIDFVEDSFECDVATEPPNTVLKDILKTEGIEGIKRYYDRITQEVVS